MEIRAYDTLTRRKRKIVPAEKGKRLLLYTCGPTVYDFAHIGNFRTYVFEDLFRRTLEYAGFPLKHVMNLTDVDDKTIRGARKEGVALDAFTSRYKKAFFEDLETLMILPAHAYPAATDYIPDMIVMIETLLAKKMAYGDGEGNVYFAIRSFPRYGALSSSVTETLRAGASNRVSADEYEKEAVSDFALWKAHDPERDGEFFWESPFGRGRPGWHIECSAMAMKLLGDTIDIHMGGVDNIFPHHENEIAQSEGCTGSPFARYWIHVEHLITEGKKMSKSLGNFYTLRDLRKRGYTGAEIRYLLSSVHYRMPLNFTLVGLEGARATLKRLRDSVRRLRDIARTRRGEGGSTCCLSHVETCRTGFRAALADDFNVSAALGSLFDLIRVINREIDGGAVTVDEAREVLRFLEEINLIFPVLTDEPDGEIPHDVRDAFAKREEARRAKKWSEADRQREYMESKGFTVEDLPGGSRITRR